MGVPVRRKSEEAIKAVRRKQPASVGGRSAASLAMPAQYLMPEDPICSHVRRFLHESASKGNADLAYGIEDEALRECVYYEYPARMVSQLQGDLLDLFLKTNPAATTILDPFMGSGTILAEAMSRGLDFIGQDLNPLSLLLGRVQAGPFFPNALTKKQQLLLNRLKTTTRGSVPDFRGRDKWFTSDICNQLARIRTAIRREGQPWARRFFWIVLAETSRLSSNSRTSTYKLHIRSPNQLAERSIDVIDLFRRILDRNMTRYRTRAASLTDTRNLKRGHYTHKVALGVHDTQSKVNMPEGMLADLVMTSPPYGDNRTTVPYGQHSYLPLQWVDWDDISEGLDASINETAYRLDAASLGGQNGVDEDDLEIYRSRSPEINRLYRALKDAPRDRVNRIISFARDLDKAVQSIDCATKPGGHLFWTLGNRTVGSESVAIDKIVPELAGMHDHVLTITRRIPRKRMATRNAISTTMQTETIVVMRKPED